jgi:uncharacterized protein GlcG (DUF336 family)
MPLTSETALHMIRASHEKAREIGVLISTAVVDDQGRLVAFVRMDGAAWVSVEVAQSKAFTAALLRRDGSELLKMSPIALAMLSSAHHGQAVMPFGSVTTLFEDGRLIAGIGCSGAHDDQDGACAHAARDSYPG